MIGTPESPERERQRLLGQIGALNILIQEATKALNVQRRIATKRRYDRFLAEMESEYFASEPPSLAFPDLDEQVALRVKQHAWRLPPPPIDERLHAAAVASRDQAAFGQKRIDPKRNRKYSNSRVGEVAAPAQMARGFVTHTCLFDIDSLPFEDLHDQPTIWPWTSWAEGNADTLKATKELARLNGWPRRRCGMNNNMDHSYFRCTLTAETPKALHIVINTPGPAGDREFWVPKSLCELKHEVLEVESWFASKEQME